MALEPGRVQGIVDHLHNDYNVFPCHKTTKTSEVEWRPVPGFSRSHRVSSFGVVVNLITGHRLAATAVKGGYLSVSLALNGVHETRRLNVLVAEAFHGPRPSPEHEARHLNGIKTDNYEGNIAWGTALENAEDRERHGMTARGERQGLSKLTEDDARAIKAELASDECRPVAVIAAEFNVSRGQIYNIKNGLSWSWLETPQHDEDEDGEPITVPNPKEQACAGALAYMHKHHSRLPVLARLAIRAKDISLQDIVASAKLIEEPGKWPTN